MPRTRILVVALLYLVAIVAANLTTTHYAKLGHPEVSVYTALGLIAFDFVARDLLHDWTRGLERVVVIGSLVLLGSLISYEINADAATIAKASAAAFAAAMLIDSIVYHAARYWVWFERSNVSNVAGAIVDSAVFCSIAGFPFVVGFGQTTAKIAGGVVFALLLERIVPVATRLRPLIDRNPPGRTFIAR